MRTKELGSAVPLYVVTCPRCGAAIDWDDYETFVTFRCAGRPTPCGYSYDQNKPEYVEDRFQQAEVSE